MTLQGASPVLQSGNGTLSDGLTEGSLLKQLLWKWCRIRYVEVLRTSIREARGARRVLQLREGL